MLYVFLYISQRYFITHQMPYDAPLQPCATPYYNLSLIFVPFFCSVEQKNNNEGYGRKWSEAQRRNEAETKPRQRAYSAVITAKHKRSGRAQLGRGVVVAKWRLGVERNGNEVTPLRLGFVLGRAP